VCPVKYELGFYIQADDILHSHYHENLKSYRRKPLGSQMNVWNSEELVPWREVFIQAASSCVQCAIDLWPFIILSQYDQPVHI
jgi:hypothetical protein